jgi:uncharacterized protein
MATSRKPKRSKTSAIGGKPWYSRGLQFECQACGQCCGGEPGYIWMTPEEIRRAAKAMGMHVLDFCSMYVSEYDRGFSLREMANGDCSMLDDGKCRIYQARPLQCRTWPWWPSNLSSRRAWQYLQRRCPGVGKGRMWRRAEIQRERDKM